MGARGRLPMPNNVRELRGNPGKRKSPVPIVGSAGLPQPPSWLRGEGLREWKRITPELNRMGLISHVDRAVLSTYCGLWELFVDLRRTLAEDGTVVEGRRKGEPVKSPAWQMFRETSGLLLKVGKELGLTPSSRLRMPNPFDPDDDDDELERLLS